MDVDSYVSLVRTMKVACFGACSLPLTLLSLSMGALLAELPFVDVLEGLGRVVEAEEAVCEVVDPPGAGTGGGAGGLEGCG